MFKNIWLLMWLLLFSIATASPITKTASVPISQSNTVMNNILFHYDGGINLPIYQPVDISVDMIDNTNQCLIDCHTTYSVCAVNQDGNDVIVTPDDISAYFKDKEGNDASLTDSYFTMWQWNDVEKTGYNTTEYPCEQNESYIDNQTGENLTRTIETTCSDSVPYSYTESEYQEVPLDSFTGCANVTVHGNKQPFENIDNIPSVFGQDWPEFAWWNATWNSMRCVNVTSSNTARVMSLNFTFPVVVSSSVIRFTSNGTGTETEANGYYRLGNYTNEVYVVNSTIANGITTICGYYNNASASTKSSHYNITLASKNNSGDDFDGNTVNTNLWTISSGTVGVINGYASVSNATTFYSKASVQGNSTKITFMQVPSDTENYQFKFDTTGGSKGWFFPWASGSNSYYYSNGSTNVKWNSGNMPVFEYFTTDFRNTAEAFFFRNNTLVGSQNNTASASQNLLIYYTGAGTSNLVAYDWVLIIDSQIGWGLTEGAWTNEINSSSNVAPSIINQTWTPTIAYKNSTLNCSAYFQDNDSATLNMTATLYRNGVLNTTVSILNNASNATYSFTLYNGNFTVGGNWSCQLNATDGSATTTGAMSANITILNSPPYFVSPTPANATNDFTYPITLNFTSDKPFGATGNFMEVEGINHTCTRSSDNLSCSYALSPAEHLFNHTYATKGWINDSGTYQSTTAYSIPYYGCGNVTANGNLLGNVSISTSDNCFTIQPNNGLTLDCKGYSLTGTTGMNNYGIYIYDANPNPTKTTIQNCVITGFDNGIYSDGNRVSSSYLHIYNNSMSSGLSGSYGITTYFPAIVSGNNITGTLPNTIETGIRTKVSANVSNNIITNCKTGMRIEGDNGYVFSNKITSATSPVAVSLFLGSSNVVYNNLFGNGAEDDGVNLWNATKTLATNIIGGPYIGGNWYFDYHGIDTNGDGIGEYPSTYSTGGAIPDYLPLSNESMTTTLSKPSNTTYTIYQVPVNASCSGSFTSYLLKIYVDGVLNSSNHAVINGSSYQETLSFTKGGHNISIACFNSSYTTAQTTVWFSVEPTLVAILNQPTNTTYQAYTIPVNGSCSGSLDSYLLNISIDANQSYISNQPVANASSYQGAATLSAGYHNASATCFNTTTIETYGLCYQETANASSAGDGICGLSYTGSYGVSGNWGGDQAKLYDGNWATSAMASAPFNAGTVLINYTKPAGALSTSMWRVATSSGVPPDFYNEFNLSIPASCWNANPTTLMLFGYSDVHDPPANATWGCFNGTDFTIGGPNSVILHDDLSSILYEEGMYWNTTSSTTILGTVSNQSATVWFTIQPAFSVALSAPADNAKSNLTSQTFNWAVSGSLASYLSDLTIDGVLNQTNIASTNGSLAAEPVSDFAQGTHTWYVTAYNQTSSNVSATWSFTIDSIAPTITIQSPANTKYNTSTVDLNYTVSDLHIDKCWYVLNSGIPIQTGCFNTSISPIQGMNIVTVYANDTYGNQNDTSVSFLYDTIAPNISIVSPANGTAYNTSILVNISAADANLDKVWFNTGGPNATYTIPTIAALSDGYYNITAYANDTYGNQNSTMVSFIVDLHAPVITLISPLGDHINNTKTVTFTYKETDMLNASCSLYVDGILKATNAMANNTPVSNVVTGNAWGAHSWNATCTDGLNSATGTSTFTIVDTVPPTMSYDSDTDPDGTTRLTSTTSFVYADTIASDSISGVASIITRLYQNGILYSTQTTSSSPLAYNWTGLPPASYEFYSTATDNAGNTATLPHRHVTIVPSVNPVVQIDSPFDTSSAYTASIRCTTNSPTNTVDLYIDGVYDQTHTCSSGSPCAFTYPTQDCKAITMLVSCTDGYGQQTNLSRVFTQVPDYSSVKPASGITITNTTSVEFNMTWNCNPASAAIQIATVPILYPMSCIGTFCSYTNGSWPAGYHLWAIQTGLTSGGYVFSPTYNFMVPMPSMGFNVTINITKTYTFAEFNQYVQDFYFDYGIYFLGILAYALAWLVTQRYPQTMIAGGLGMLVIYMITGNVTALVMSIVSVIIGLMFKYTVG